MILRGSTIRHTNSSLFPRRTFLLASISVRQVKSVRSMASTTIREKVEQPTWHAPAPPAMVSQLKIYNSLTRTKTPFSPLDPAGRKVTWYCCGPTVYDVGHLGHARNYVTTDILRRILNGYFGYDVQFVQNVTDIDDKIILRARQSHLLKQFIEQNPTINAQVLSTTNDAWQAYMKKIAPDAELTPATFVQWASKTHPQLMDAEGEAKLDEQVPARSSEDIENDVKMKMHLKTLANAAGVINTPSSEVNVFYDGVKDILSPYLDKRDGHSVTDPKIFRDTAAYWENHFNEDMAKLNVLPPTITTRVSEFVPENVSFVETLVNKGFAYPTTDGSVYFDVEAYRGAGHHYAKLQPWNAASDSLLQDGEGALTSQDTKKGKGDFALWKASKPGEPGWDSPWGKGRPGWHIECSVMCSEVLGKQVDIHSGGIDLAFPHHDNEIAQSEAFWDPCTASDHSSSDRHQWVNYFIHMGHLEISGAKMSKSLKNFVSIREALDRGGGWTSRRLRIVFLLGGWKDRIEIREGVINEAQSFENTLNKFFTKVRSLRSEQELKEASGETVPQLFGEREHALWKEFDAARNGLHEALCDSFNTSAALGVILELVSKSNIYMNTPTSIAILSNVALWVTKMIHTFGLDAAPYSPTTIGWSDAALADDASGVNKEDIATPYVRLLSSFRDKIRALAISDPKSPTNQQLLSLCDVLRDDELPQLGVSLDDRDVTKPALVKFVPAEQLLAEKREKEEALRRKEEDRERKRRDKEKADLEKKEKSKKSHLDMFKTDEFSAWDEDGLPTTDKDGVLVAKNRLKKLRGEHAAQKKLHETYLASLEQQK